MKNGLPVLFSIILLNFACQKKHQPKVIFKHFPEKWHLNQTVKIYGHNLKEFNIDRVLFKVDQNIRGGTKPFDTLRIPPLPGITTGKHRITFYFFSRKKFIDSLTRPFTLFASKPPFELKYQLIAEYPHEINAFTQGLEFDGDTLYESTGLNGESSLRKTDFKTGKIIKKYNLPKQYFGEGITIWNDSIIWLTWQSKKGFVFNKKTFEQIGSFPYGKSKEGWGLTHNDRVIFKSDGTEKIRILDPETLREIDSFSVYSYKHPIKRINELEWINGKLFTNIWQKNALAVINPENGEVEAVVNLKPLLKKLKKHPGMDVLNGIAFHHKSGHIFVTGKKWDKLFEIEIDSNSIPKKQHANHPPQGLQNN